MSSMEEKSANSDNNSATKKAQYPKNKMQQIEGQPPMSKSQLKILWLKNQREECRRIMEEKAAKLRLEQNQGVPEINQDSENISATAPHSKTFISSTHSVKDIQDKNKTNNAFNKKFMYQNKNKISNFRQASLPHHRPEADASLLAEYQQYREQFEAQQAALFSNCQFGESQGVYGGQEYFPDMFSKESVPGFLNSNDEFDHQMRSRQMISQQLRSFRPSERSPQYSPSSQGFEPQFSAPQEFEGLFKPYSEHEPLFSLPLPTPMSQFAEQLNADFQEFEQQDQIFHPAPPIPPGPSYDQRRLPQQRLPYQPSFQPPVQQQLQPAAPKAFGYAAFAQQYGAISQSSLAAKKVHQYTEFVYIVEFKRKRTEFLISTSCVDQITVGDVVMVTTSDKSGLDMGVLVEILSMAVFLSTSRRNLVAHPLSSILRRAWETEKRSIVQKLRDESEVQQYASELSYEVYKLNILVVDAEYQFDRKKLTLYYQRTSAASVSLESFMKNMSSTFSAKVCMEKIIG